MMIVYIGSFPPPYGGVTIKNKMLYDNLSKSIKIKKINLSMIKKLNLFEIFHLILSMFFAKGYVIGSAKTSRRLITKFLYYFRKKALRKSLLVVMGGIASKEISKDDKFRKWASGYGRIYVETNGMKAELNDVGLDNVDIFPNCREKPKVIYPLIKNTNGALKLVYFSLISKDKGADICIEAARSLNEAGINYNLDFYGPISDDYKDIFLDSIIRIEQIKYQGIFNSAEKDVYEKLNEYDVLLFPSNWKAEGVPGVLVESKISGIPTIASNNNYNSDIIKDNEDGLILLENTSLFLTNAIKNINNNRDDLFEMKKNARLSGEKYYIDRYIPFLLKYLAK